MRIDAIVTRAMARSPLAGLTVGIAHRDVVFVKGYGQLDRERGVATDTKTVYRIGSITKQFTAAAVMRLAESNQVALDDPITKYLSDYPHKQVTIRHLLSQSSGIAEYVDEAFDRTKAWQRDEILALFQAKPLAFEPGTHWAYSNANYYLLGMIVERVTKQPFFDVLAHQLAALGAHTIRPCGNVSQPPDEATGYQDDAGKLVPAKVIHMSWPFAAGGLCATAADLLAWGRNLRAGKIVRPSSYRMMMTPSGLPEDPGYALGSSVGVLVPGHRATISAGAMIGYSSLLVDLPDDDLTVAVLLNTRNDEVPMTIARRLILEQLGLGPGSVPLPRDAQRRFGGRFQLPNGVVIEYRIEGDDVTGGPSDGPRRALVYLGNDRFTDDKGQGFELRFIVGADGVATAVEARLKDQPAVVGKRVP